jgi:hypothetical protein
MPMTAFESAKNMLSQASEARECVVHTNDSTLPPKATFIPYEAPDMTSLPFLQAAVTRVDPEARLIVPSDGSGIAFSFSKHYATPPFQQINQQLRNIERELPNCISRAADGNYIITRSAKIMPLDVHDMLGTIAKNYYARHHDVAKNTGAKTEPPHFDATPYYTMPKGEVFIDSEGLRHTRLNTKQAKEYIETNKENGKTQYEFGTLFDHAILGPIAAHEVLTTLGMLPEMGRRPS